VDGYISESCPMAGFSISVVEPSGSTAPVFINLYLMALNR